MSINSAWFNPTGTVSSLLDLYWIFFFSSKYCSILKQKQKKKFFFLRSTLNKQDSPLFTMWILYDFKVSTCSLSVNTLLESSPGGLSNINSAFLIKIPPIEILTFQKCVDSIVKMWRLKLYHKSLLRRVCVCVCVVVGVLYKIYFNIVATWGD